MMFRSKQSRAGGISWPTAVRAILFGLIGLTSFARAQEVSVTLVPDSTHILIGDFLNVELRAEFPADVSVVWPSVADTLGEMELVRASKIDTATSEGGTVLTQSLIVSAYDSGTYRLGPVSVVFTDKSGISDTVISASGLISVETIPVDTTQAIKPIKQPLPVPYSWREFAPYLIGAAVLMAAVAGLIYYLRRRKKKAPPSPERPKPRDPAHIWAKNELRKLEEEKLWQKDEVKQYYSRLTDILRLYLEYRYGWMALESTTEQIADEISQFEMAKEEKDKLLGILRRADMVKFAKRLPMPDENDLMMSLAVEFVERTGKPESEPESKT